MKSEKKEKKYSPQDFMRAYKELCDKMGYVLRVGPVFRARDDGTWSTVLQTSISRLPKVNTNGKKTRKDRIA